MANSVLFNMMDRLLKPQKCYEISEFSILGFQLIASKEDQRLAGRQEGLPPKKRTRSFGASPVKPYRDYYGKFKLKTTMIDEEITVQFAIGYSIYSPFNTVDDYSNFSWLRLAIEMEGMIYPNLANQKQLLDYLIKNSRYPQFVIIRVYHYLQTELYHKLTNQILMKEDSIIRK
jgi:hypothetical protein